MSYHPDVMISSTARDLPDHRRQAEQACLRQNMIPIMMEQIPASETRTASNQSGRLVQSMPESDASANCNACVPSRR